MAIDDTVVNQAQIDAAKSFQKASEDLRRMAENQGKVTFIEEAGLTKRDLLTKLEDKFLKSQIARAAYNQFIAIRKQKKEDKAMADALGMDRLQYKRYKRQVAEDKATKAFEAQRVAAMEEMVGEETTKQQLAMEAIKRDEDRKIAESEQQLANGEITAEAHQAQIEASDLAKENAEKTLEETRKSLEDKAALDQKEADERATIDAKALIEGRTREAHLANMSTEAYDQMREDAEKENELRRKGHAEDDRLRRVQENGIEAASLEIQRQGEVSNAAADSEGEEGGGGGMTPAEMDADRAAQVEFRNRQIDLLQQIADNIGGASGGSAEDSSEGSSPFGKAMKGALSGLGKGIGALGKGIGVFLKMVGSGAGKLIVSLAKGFAALGKALGPIGKGLGKAITFLLKGLAKGVKAFINPAVIGGLAVFTLGMIGLGAALRLAAPAFEALAPIIIKMADVIGNVLMTAIKEIPEIFRSIGYVIESVGITITAVIDAIGGAIESVGKGFLMIGESVKRVLNGIASVVKAIGDSISGVIGSIGSSIAEVVNAVRGDARAEAEAQIAVLEAQTLSIQKLSRLDPGTMAATAAGIESIKNALAGLGSPSLMGAIGKFLGDDGPIGELLELAKNAQGITDASNALVKFVENAKLFEEGIEIDDSVIKGIQRVVKALGSGNPQALGSFSNAVNAINNIDEKKIGLLSKINIPQVMPPTAAEYERIFKALQTAEPSTIEKVQGFFSKVFSRPQRSQRSQRPQRGSALESMRQRQSVDAAGASGGKIDQLKALIADPNTTNTDRTRAKKKLRRLQQAEAAGFSRENVTAAGGSMSSINAAAKDVAGAAVTKQDSAEQMILTPAQKKKLDFLRDKKEKMRPGGRGEKSIERDIRHIERMGKAAYNKSMNPNRRFSGDLSGRRNMQAAAIAGAPPSANNYGGGPSGATNVSTISAPTTNVNHHHSPVNKKPTSEVAKLMRSQNIM